MDEKEIINIISKYAKKNADELNLNLKFKEDLHLDSIDLLQLVMEIEEKFNVKLKNEDLLNIVTIKDAIDKLKNA